MDALGTRRWIPFVVIAAALLALLPEQVFAGPPLVCRPFEIGSAPSLPWGTGGWNSPSASYPLDHLVTDTLSLLSPEAPVLARMETIRRATIYASRNVTVAADLLSAVSRRAFERNSATSDAHAWFDFGYLVETFKQADFLFKDGNPARGMDGYRHIRKAIALDSNAKADMESAAALVAQR
jgi:hypothetical protein